jgi:hypothetical protein
MAQSSDLDLIDKIIGWTTSIAATAPATLTVTGVYPLSLYQPYIYKDRVYFLVIPGLILLFSTWAVARKPRATMPISIIFGAGLFLAIVVFFIYETVPTSNVFVHRINWILSYGVLALTAPLAFGLLVRLRPRKAKERKSTT